MTGLRKTDLDRILAAKSQQKITLEPIEAKEAGLKVARDRYDSIVGRASGDDVNSKYSISQAQKDSLRSSTAAALESITLTDQKRKLTENLDEYTDRD